jgi:hypothetical protein
MYDAKRLGRDRSIVFDPTAARDRSVRTAQAQEENEDHLGSVIALAEALDARDPSTHAHSRTMISNRPYRQGMDPAAAQAELARCRGTQFDGAVVDAFLRALREDDAPGPPL